MPFTRFSGFCAIAMLSLFTSACSGVRYLAHVTHGQMQLVTQREPLDKVIAAPNTDAQLAKRLALARDARRFASTQLHLPDNRSYTTYVDLHRPYVVWNVFAAPKFFVDPLLQCFPIAGCVPYRGYFDETQAKSRAAELQARGNDVYVGGVSAYSTLGWFADPILSTMMRWDVDELIGTIFHELAHQLIYVKDDTAFNESFASFVQDEGLREWRTTHGLPAPEHATHDDDDAFARLVLDLREHLRAAYAAEHDDDEREAAKQREFATFRERYRVWREANPHNDGRYDAFVAAPANNARLVPFGLYDQWTPAFAAVFAQSGNDWQRFYARVRELAKMPSVARTAALQKLAAGDATKETIR